jgi:ribosomal-protein-serine acetyltransferase
VLSLQIDDDVRLTDLEPWHAEQLAELFRAHGADFYDWLPWEGFEDVEGARGFIDGFTRGRGEGNRRLYGIWVGDELVGGTLFPSINARSRIAEAGVFLAASARGRGIVTRAVAAMLDWASPSAACTASSGAAPPATSPAAASPSGSASPTRAPSARSSPCGRSARTSRSGRSSPGSGPA